LHFVFFLIASQGNTGATGPAGACQAFADIAAQDKCLIAAKVKIFYAHFGKSSCAVLDAGVIKNKKKSKRNHFFTVG